MAGIRSSRGHVAKIEAHNYNYAQQMAHAGFLTSPRTCASSASAATAWHPFPGRDACNVNFIKGAMLGRYALTLNIWDSCAASTIWRRGPR